MIRGAGRHRLSGDSFSPRADLGPADARRSGTRSRPIRETAAAGGPGQPVNSHTRSFAKPTGLQLNASIISDTPHEIVRMAREMFDNDPVSGAVVEVIAGIPFGSHTLSGMPDHKLLDPYFQSLDHIRVKTLLPVLATTFMVDGAFLGSGVFNASRRVYDAVIPQDVLHSRVYPVPGFGATPIVDLEVSPDMAKAMASLNDPRMKRYRDRLPPEMLKGGTIKLEPENTFYLPRRGMAHSPLGTSMFRRIMVVYALEKALQRGTVEMAYRRQRAILHVVAGDENWDPSQDEMQELSDLFLAADLDPLGAVLVTRQGVQAQEVLPGGDFWRWTDNVDVLTQVKLKGLGMPDGLLGGDMALDSVSATLTIFINMIRSFRDYITRLFFYEKLFPYIAVTNEHRRDRFDAFEATGSSNARYHSRAADLEDVDLSDYVFPTVAWHNSMRPEGDRDYMELLNNLQQAGVPVPLRMMAAAGGLDIQDILNSADDDLEVRQKVAEYMAQTQAMSQESGGGDQGGGYGEEGSDLLRLAAPVKRKGLLAREWDDRHGPSNQINGRRYLMTARERKRIEEKQDRVIARAATDVHARIRALCPRQVVNPAAAPRRIHPMFGVQQ